MPADNLGIWIEQFLMRHRIHIISAHAIRCQVRELINTRQATVHPYGFFILKIPTLAGQQLRIHVWLAGARPGQVPEWPPHDHSFSISSLILDGAVTNQTWNVIESPDGNKCLYEVHYGQDCSILLRTDRKVLCELADEATYRPGEAYEVPLNVFHSTVVPMSEHAMSLCLMHNGKTSSPKVVGALDADIEYKFKRPNCSDDNMDALKRYYEAIFC